MHEHRRGTFAFNAPTNHIEALTGRPAETFETTARRYAVLPGLVDNVANRARTLADFARIGMRPSTDLDAFERDTDLPVPPVRRLAIDDERWLIDRDAHWSRLPAARRLDLREVEAGSAFAVAPSMPQVDAGS